MKKSFFLRLAVSVSVFSLGFLVAPITSAGLALTALCCLIAVSLLWFFAKRLDLRPLLQRSVFLYCVMIGTLLCQDFIIRWMPSRKLAGLARMLQLPTRSFLLAAAILLALVALPAIDLAIRLCGRIFSLLLKNRDPLRFRKALRILLVVFFQYYSLGFSAENGVGRIIYIPLLAFLANFGVLLLFNLFFSLLLRKWSRALVFCSTLFFLWSLANYYTIQFHGSPLYLSEFLNFQAAAAVAGNYKYQISGVVIGLILLYAAELYTVRRGKECFGVPLFPESRVFGTAASLAVIVLVTIGCSIFTLDRFRLWQPWNDSIDESGFAICVIKDLQLRFNPIVKPEGYDEARLTEIFSRESEEAPEIPADGDFPDIVLIVNETFCDLTPYTDLLLDSDPLVEFYGIPGATYGWIVVPSVGGGTNNTEFELLSSYSMHLLRSYAPYTYLDADQLDHSSVNYLRDCGYQTVGMHCQDGRNYSRDSAYPHVGFDRIALGPESFSYFGKNGNRSWTDSDNYRDLMDQYESLDDSPRFVYMLTFQNHGGFEQNDASLDTVHVLNDFGGLTDDLNEYLSSLEFSAKAFRELTEYFSGSERRVIVCMMGDHAPSFLPELPASHSMSFEEAEIAKRTVPYVIWTNYGASIPVYTDYASAVDLLPMLMRTAGIPCSPFLRYVLELHQMLPVRTSNGICMDRFGACVSYFDDEEIRELMDLYYYLEYHSLTAGEEYCRELFEAK